MKIRAGSLATWLSALALMIAAGISTPGRSQGEASSAKADESRRNLWYICRADYSLPGSSVNDQYFVTEPFESEEIAGTPDGWQSGGYRLSSDLEEKYEDYLAEDRGLERALIFSRSCYPHYDREGAQYFFDAHFSRTSRFYNPRNRAIPAPPKGLLSPSKEQPQLAEAPETAQPEEPAKLSADDAANAVQEELARSDVKEAARVREEEAKREQERLEAEETARLNREAADFAAKQVAENEASRRKEEAERKAYEEALAKAEREKAEYERAMEQNRREREEANRRQQEYFAAQRRHALCVGGDRKACADIEAGKPAMGEQLADAGEASTDTDARRCVSSPVVGVDSTFRGSTRAAVTNGCDTAVDVRICLLRTGGWNCGVVWGLAPQESWSHTSFETDGQVFWDARVARSARPLGTPQGS